MERRIVLVGGRQEGGQRTHWLPSAGMMGCVAPKPCTAFMNTLPVRLRAVSKLYAQSPTHRTLSKLPARTWATRSSMQTSLVRPKSLWLRGNEVAVGEGCAARKESRTRQGEP